MRLTTVAWWCYRGHKNDPSTRTCTTCEMARFERHAQVHTQDRAVVYYNPVTGEHRTPARSDMPMPQQYAAQGYERREIMHMGAWEKEAGVAHEATTFNPGNEGIPERHPESHCPPELKEELLREVAAAASSGPWTGADKLL